MLGTGDERYKGKVHDKINEYGLSKNIKFCDWVNNKAMDYMREADIYVDTIYRPTQGQGTGKTMLEALSSGLAIAAPDNPSIELYIHHNINALFYRGNNADSLADTLMLLIKNRQLRLTLMRNARQFALKELDLSKNMRIMEKKYFNLIKKNNT